MSTQDVVQRIEELESQLTGNLFQDLELKDEIHKLKMNLNNVKPTDSSFECVGCGSQFRDHYLNNKRGFAPQNFRLQILEFDMMCGSNHS